METNETPLGLLERLNAWIQESIMIKLLSIGFLVLILLIPSSWIQDLITERQFRADEAMNEVAAKWSGSQTISGPVLVIPYTKQEVIDRGKEGVEIIEHTEKAFFLPENLDINGKITPTILHRGIFDAVVYESTLDVKSVFGQPDFKSLNIDDKFVHWHEAFLTFGITDLRGISDNPIFKVGPDTLTTEPSSNLGISSSKPADAPDYSDDRTTQYSHYSSSGIIAKLNWQNKESFNGMVSINLPLKGSKRLDFVPAGKTTVVALSGPWNDPSFDGVFLPQDREITEDGFTAKWKVLHFNRPFAQQWVETNQHLTGAEFGVKLLIPVDQYQKSMRTSKYGALIILLTFIAMFLVEITQKIRIHPFQYILIGAALTIYYTLLISFSEHIGYNIAYLIASLATVLLISFYSTTFLRSTRLSVLFTIVLTIFYTFVFVIIQEQDFSLLIGSIGLFLIIGMLMYFSRKINWYKQVTPTDVKA
jgi:inner membrane protein